MLQPASKEHGADRLAQRVVIVDTGNALGGHAAIPHSLLLKARRISVPSHGKQAKAIAEAVSDHSPEVRGFLHSNVVVPGRQCGWLETLKINSGGLEMHAVMQHLALPECHVVRHGRAGESS